MTAAKHQVIVAGGGPAGLAAACLLALEGIDTMLVAPTAGDDPRTVAAMLPALRLLRYIGVWPDPLSHQSEALKKLRIKDDSGALLTSPEIVFAAKEVGEDAFGWNIPLAALIEVMRAHATKLGVTIKAASAVAAVPQAQIVRLTLDSGEEVEAQACLAADGRDSLLRDAAGIGVERWSYDQTALATSFAHSAPHDGVSTEYYKHAGPMTTVPMPGLRSSLVWMDRPARIAALMEVGDAGLAAEIQAETHGELGRIDGMGARKSIPMMGLTARRFAARRIMLIGEAAHVVPPIGAQGLNMSLRDAALAVDLILGARDDPGADGVLNAYDARRRHEVAPRQYMIDIMNRSLTLGMMPLEGARAASLWTLHNAQPLRREIMRLGMADDAGLPFAMRV
jgi:2-octaprenyl-6-methoxyphenol hydroxylase